MEAMKEAEATLTGKGGSDEVPTESRKREPECMSISFLLTGMMKSHNM